MKQSKSKRNNVSKRKRKHLSKRKRRNNSSKKGGTLQEYHELVAKTYARVPFRGLLGCELEFNNILAFRYNVRRRKFSNMKKVGEPKYTETILKETEFGNICISGDIVPSHEYSDEDRKYFGSLVGIETSTPRVAEFLFLSKRNKDNTLELSNLSEMIEFLYQNISTIFKSRVILFSDINRNRIMYMVDTIDDNVKFAFFITTRKRNIYECAKIQATIDIVSTDFVRMLTILETITRQRAYPTPDLDKAKEYIEYVSKKEYIEFASKPNYIESEFESKTNYPYDVRFSKSPYREMKQYITILLYYAASDFSRDEKSYAKAYLNFALRNNYDDIAPYFVGPEEYAKVKDILKNFILEFLIETFAFRSDAEEIMEFNEIVNKILNNMCDAYGITRLPIKNDGGSRSIKAELRNVDSDPMLEKIGNKYTFATPDERLDVNGDAIVDTFT